MNAFKNQHTFEAYSGRVEASIIDESDCLVAFSAQIGHKSTTMGVIDPQLQALVKVEDLHQTQELYILNTDADDIPGRMDTYMRRVAKLLFAQEASPFMKATLGLASELCEGLLDQRVSLQSSHPSLLSEHTDKLAGCVARVGPTALDCLAHSG